MSGEPKKIQAEAEVFDGCQSGSPEVRRPKAQAAAAAVEARVVLGCFACVDAARGCRRSEAGRRACACAGTEGGAVGGSCRGSEATAWGQG
eukprot:366514-Chlamydomonas_euryale.AAC.1